MVQQHTTTTTTLHLLMVAWILLGTACADSGASNDDGTLLEPDTETSNGTGSETPSSALQWLTPVEHLTRASLAIRGQRPSLDELDQVRRDPAALEIWVDQYLSEPGFGEVVRDMHNDIWQLRSTTHWFPPLEGIATMDMVTLNASVTEAPLKLIEHVVVNDRPYSEILTADYTLADGVVAEVWGLEYSGDGFSWEQTRWDTSSDELGPWSEPGRPHAGILSDSYLFTRHDTTVANQNRGRANQVSQALLCFDFLTIPIDIDATVDLSDPEAVAQAVSTDPACLGCHQSLDPLSQFFWIYDVRYNPGGLEAYPQGAFYHPERVRQARNLVGLTPGYFGQAEPEGTFWSVRDLGQMIVDDPRFSLCAVQRFYSHFTQTPLEEVPTDEAKALQDSFIASGLNARQLVRTIVLSDAFRKRSATPEASQEVADQLVGLRRLRPRQMARTLETLTGFAWVSPLELELGGGVLYGPVDLMRDPLLGFLVLAGGIDSYQVQTPLTTFNATAFLSQTAYAREAAAYAVGEDLATDAAQRRLLTDVSADTRDEATIRAQLAQLHLRLFSEEVEPTSDAVDLSYTLWSDLLALSDNPTRAWTLTLMAMFQDPRFVFY
ncbi:MAG: DUF1585 domain-containing protein [Myxococcota bacterium]